jgi:hypothetical protein
MEFQSPAGAWLASILGQHDPQLWWQSAMAAGLGAGIGAFICGAMLSFPVSRFWIRPVFAQIHPERIVYGRTCISWQDILYYQADRSRRLLKLFSRSNPRSLALVLHPPSDALFQEAEGKLRELLSEKKSGDGLPELRRRRLSGLMFLMTALFLLAAALWTFQFVAEWVWFLYAAAIAGYSAYGFVLERI